MALQNPVEPLSPSLQTALRAAPGGTEEPVISLAGNYNQAVVVTANHVFLLKDGPAGSGIQCQSYALSEVKGARVREESGNGVFAIEGADGAFINMPTFYMDKFRAAADLVNARLSAPTAAPEPPPAPVAPPPAVAAPPISAPASAAPVIAAGAALCPSCSAPLKDTTVFCPQCGTKVADICGSCEAVIPVGSKYCPRCGRTAKPVRMDCGICGARIYPQRSGFCPSCGARVSTRCAGCGASLQEEWKICPVCGRKLGAEESLRTRPEVTKDGSMLPGFADIPPAAQPVPADQGEAERYNQEGARYYDGEQYEQAITAFREAVRLDPGNSLYRCNLAVALGEGGQEEAAFNEFRKVLESNPNDITALLNLGYMYSERERKEEARQAWERVVQLSPDSPEGQEAQENLQHLQSL